MPEILKENKVYKGKLEVEEATFKKIGKETGTYSRERVNRQNAATVFIYNRDRETVVLTQQYRYPLYDRTSNYILELVAGKVDEGEEPLETAIRESEEEAGYRIKPQNIRLLASYFASPGYTTEKFYLYYAEVSAEDKISPGGGLPEEQEVIEVIEMPYAEFMQALDEGRLEDGKTLLAALYVSTKIRPHKR